MMILMGMILTTMMMRMMPTMLMTMMMMAMLRMMTALVPHLKSCSTKFSSSLKRTLESFFTIPTFFIHWALFACFLYLTKCFDI